MLLLATPCNQKKKKNSLTNLLLYKGVPFSGKKRARVQPYFISYESSCFEKTVILSQ